MDLTPLHRNSYSVLSGQSGEWPDARVQLTVLKHIETRRRDALGDVATQYHVFRNIVIVSQ